MISSNWISSKTTRFLLLHHSCYFLCYLSNRLDTEETIMEGIRLVHNLWEFDMILTSAMWLACHELNSTLFLGHVFDLSIRYINMGFPSIQCSEMGLSMKSCYKTLWVPYLVTSWKEPFREDASLQRSRHRNSSGRLLSDSEQLFPTIEMHILCSLEINKEIIAIGVINNTLVTKRQIWDIDFGKHYEREEK